jgi:hypothetical protein
MSNWRPTMADAERNEADRRASLVRGLLDGLLDKAEKARLKPPRSRRVIVFSLVKDVARMARDPVMRTQLCTVSKLFEVAYGDETGAEYWCDWIDASKPVSNVMIAEVLAAHVGAEGYAGEDAVDSFEWPLLRETRVNWIVETLAAIKGGSLRERLEAMVRDRTCEDLIPPSLRRFLTASPPAPPVVAPAAEADAKPIEMLPTVAVGDAKTPKATPHVARARGPKPVQFERVLKEMR